MEVEMVFLRKKAGFCLGMLLAGFMFGGTALSFTPPFAEKARVCEEGESRITYAFRTLEATCPEGFRAWQRQGGKTVCTLQHGWCLDQD